MAGRAPRPPRMAAGAGPRPEGGARDPFALERRHAGPDTLIPIASEKRAS